MNVPYGLLLGLHLAAVTVFVAVLLLVVTALPALTAARPLSADQHREARWLARAARYVATPALLLVWALGIAMAVRGGWFAMTWLHAKLVLVVLLSALHGRALGALRRLLADRPVPRQGFGVAALAAVAVLGIVLLVIAKPA